MSVKPRAAVNAAPLIFLAKAGLLDVLGRLYGTVTTTRGVMDEIEKPLKMGLPAREIPLITRAKWLRVVELQPKEEEAAEALARKLGVSLGEAEVGVLCRKGFDVLVVADRRAQRKLREEGVPAIDLLDAGYEAALAGLVEIQEFAQKLWDAGYRTERVDNARSLKS